MAAERKEFSVDEQARKTADNIADTVFRFGVIGGAFFTGGLGLTPVQNAKVRHMASKSGLSFMGSFKDVFSSGTAWTGYRRDSSRRTIVYGANNVANSHTGQATESGGQNADIQVGKPSGISVVFNVLLGAGVVAGLESGTACVIETKQIHEEERQHKLKNDPKGTYPKLQGMPLVKSHMAAVPSYAARNISPMFFAQLNHELMSRMPEEYSSSNTVRAVMSVLMGGTAAVLSTPLDSTVTRKVLDPEAPGLVKMLRDGGLDAAKKSMKGCGQRAVSFAAGNFLYGKACNYIEKHGPVEAPKWLVGLVSSFYGFAGDLRSGLSGHYGFGSHHGECAFSGGAVKTHKDELTDAVSEPVKSKSQEQTPS